MCRSFYNSLSNNSYDLNLQILARLLNSPIAFNPATNIAINIGVAQDAISAFTAFMENLIPGKVNLFSDSMRDTLRDINICAGAYQGYNITRDTIMDGVNFMKTLDATHYPITYNEYLNLVLDQTEGSADAYSA